MDQDNINLVGAFASYDQCLTMINALLHNPNSAWFVVLALEGLSRIEQDVNRNQFTYDVHEEIRDFLRKWRCESLNGEYTILHRQILERLTIFKTLGVPLFIDEYGTKRLMTQFNGVVAPIDITLDTPIVHVTHTLQKNQIVAMNGFIPSDKKNIIAGLWFSPKYQLGDPLTSPYGNWAFETTLRKLGVSGLRQGEIVSYKQEVNFIVYASDTVQLPPVLKATDDAAKLSQNRLDAYTAVSIFVPSRFLPTPCPPTFGATPPGPPTFGAPPPCPPTFGAPPPGPPTFGEFYQAFQAAFGEPYQVLHGPFCVQEKRQVLPSCEDLIPPYPPPMHPQQPGTW